MRKRIKFVIKAGTATSIYDDDISQLLQKKLHAQAEVSRVSHVEPVAGKHNDITFEADLAPVKGPKLIGIKSYKAAVTAEISWLEENHIVTKKQAQAIQH